MPEAWLLFIAERGGRPIASSLIALNDSAHRRYGQTGEKVAYGRYWGALERVDCLHFEACYYQPLQWCIAARLRPLRGRRAGRAQDGARAAAGAHHAAPTGWPTRPSPMRCSASWSARAKASIPARQTLMLSAGAPG
jgi:predicted N-acyltransferase